MSTCRFWITPFTAALALAAFLISTAAGGIDQERRADSPLRAEASRLREQTNFTVLEPGRPLAFTLPADGQRVLYHGDYGYVVRVPANATRLQINMVTFTPSADLDLYVRYGTDVTVDSGGTAVYDHRSARTGTGNETVTITPSTTPPLRAGSYYIGIVVWSTPVAANGTITATVDTETPTPSISTLSPNTAVAGGPGFTLTVNGANFVFASVVNWNAAPLTTTFVSATQLTATVAAANIATPGSASITVSNPGPVTSSPSTFTITTPLALPPKPITADSFYNAVGGQREGLAPGSIAKVVSGVLAPGIQGCVAPAEPLGPLPLLLAEVTIEFSGYFAPIIKVCNTGSEQSVTFQVPFELEAGFWPVTIRVNNTPYSVAAVKVSAVSPAVYLTRMSDGQRRALILRPNGSYVSVENPAQRGEVLRAFAVGLGSLTPSISSNTPGGGQVSDLSLRYPVVVGVHSTGAPLVYAKYAPNLVGVYEVGFRLPDGVPSGRNILFVIAAEVDGKLVFSDGTSIPVQ